MKKILIIYATAGEGHKRAAFAIKGAFEELDASGAEVNIVDSLDYTNKFFRWLYPRMYIFMVTYIPTIWGFFYYFLDLRRLNPLVRFVRRVVNGKNAKRFEDFLCETPPDIIISTHFLASEAVSSLKRRGKIRTKLLTCVTDFRMHSFWFSDQTDYFLVGFKETERDLVEKWRFPKERIFIVGIPIHPKFYINKNKEEVKNRYGLSKDLFTVLITGGGFGVGPIMSLVKVLMKMKERLQVLVVCGHNAELREQIDNLKPITYSLSPIIKTFGFIDYVDELMSISDIGVTKAGGLICSEAIAKELPLAIIAPIPGQETRNCKLLLANNAAFKLNRPAGIKGIIRRIYYDKGLVADMRRNIQAIKKLDAALNIAKFALAV